MHELGGPSKKRPPSIVPWHMWGTSKIITVPLPSSSATQFVQSGQLARVNYKRPETWHFLFVAELLAAPDGVAGNNVDVIVDFDIFVGIGRAVAALKGRAGEPGFARLTFHYAGPASAQVGITKWTTQATSEVSNTPTILNPNPIVLPVVEFPAQDIQCSARVTTQSASADPLPTKVEVHAYFAPKNHIRPDWFDREYMGEEKEGT
ncbi:MAG TPA: hypothetical protein VF405_00840 [Gammaproteobacteria bacterium]